MEIITPDILRTIISEERKHVRLRRDVNSFLIQEEQRLLSLGYPQHLVEGAIWDFLGSFGTEFLKGYKNQFSRWLIANLGFDPNSFIAQTIGNLIEETPVSEIWGWVRGQGRGCEKFGEKLTDAILETIEEKMLNPLAASLGFRNMAVGSVGGTFREQFQTWLKSTELRQDVVDMVVNTVCEFKMSSIMGVGAGWNRPDTGEEESGTGEGTPSEESGVDTDPRAAGASSDAQLTGKVLSTLGLA